MKQYRLGVAAGLVVAAAGSVAQAFPLFLTELQAKYPTSTVDERMAALTGFNCNTCHHPPSRSDLGNCYRADIITLLGMGRTITQALDELDAVDSDGDGISNGEEITMPRADQPGQIGYSPGLIGATGTDPCATNTSEVVSGQRETPVVVPVPTVGEWGLAVMSLALLAAGSVALRRTKLVVTPRSSR
jgi:hypothetical protein